MSSNAALNYILTDAVEGMAIIHWAEITDIQRNVEGLVTSFKVRDAEGEVGLDWIEVTPEKLVEASKSILDGSIRLAKEIQSQFDPDIANWDVDVNGTDCLIQIIAFDDILFD